MILKKLATNNNLGNKYRFNKKWIAMDLKTNDIVYIGSFSLTLTNVINFE